MKELELKFNGGSGALLCPHCRTVIAKGFAHAGSEYKCWGCYRTVAVDWVDEKFVDTRYTSYREVRDD